MKLFSFYINSCLLSEEGYYPFGMTMSAISSTAVYFPGVNCIYIPSRSL